MGQGSGVNRFASIRARRAGRGMEAFDQGTICDGGAGRPGAGQARRGEGRGGEGRKADDDLVSLAAISKRQDISLPYLEQLFVKLRRAGLGPWRRCAAPAAATSWPAPPRRSGLARSCRRSKRRWTRCTPGQGPPARSRARGRKAWRTGCGKACRPNVYVSSLHQVRLSDVVQNDLTPCPAVPSLFRVWTRHEPPLPGLECHCAVAA